MTKTLRTYKRGVLAALLTLVGVLTLSSFGPLPQHTPSNYEDRIRAQFRAQRWEEGGAILDSALQEYPAVAAFYELKGQKILHDLETGKGIARQVGRHKAYELARYHLIKCIDMDEKNLNARRLLLRIEIETKHYSSAIVYCNELLEQTPYNEHLWRTKIDLYRKMGNKIEADRLLERLMTIYSEDQQLRKDYVNSKEELVLEQRKKGDYQGMEESLRELIKLRPTNAEYYQQLFGILYRTGRLDEAAQIAEQASQSVQSVAQRDSFIARRVGILMETNRFAEAQNYLNSKTVAAANPYLQRIKTELDIEIARQARLNDPFEAYAKVYDKQHSQEALDYLISTAIQRNYYDDALFYVREARRQHDTPQLHYKEYMVLKRMGYDKKSVQVLRELYERDRTDEEVANELAVIYLNDAAELIAMQQYDEALELLTYIDGMDIESELQETTQQRMLNCYIQTKKYDLAEAMLDQHADRMPATRYCAQKAMLLHLRGQSKAAMNMLFSQYRALPVTQVQERQDLSYSYEEIAVPYIKSLNASGMTYAAWNQVQEALEICPQSNEILHYAISLSLAQKKQDLAQTYVEQGMQTFPNDPYFKVKNAQLLILDKDYSSSVDSLRALLDVYPGDSTILLAFTDCSESLALQYMKMKQNEQALAVLDTALYFNPESHTLLYTKSLVYRKMKQWREAENCLKGYKPDFREMTAYRRSLEELLNQQMKNNLSIEYQQARLGSEDAITGNAYLSYTRKLPRINRNGQLRTDALSFGLAYAGRDGKASNEAASDLTKGGTGILVTAAYEHQFTSRFTARAEGGWSNRYFPTLLANLSASYDMKKEWQLTARANFRWLKTYTGVYEMSHDFAGYDPEGELMYANVMKLTDYTIKNKPMIQLGVGTNKTFGEEDRFNTAVGVDGFMLSGNFYVNANAKLMFFPLQDKKTHIFAQAGLGTAPESSLIDQSLAVGFSDLNTFVSMGGQYFVNRYITLGLNGSWYTMLTQKETLSLPLNGTTAQISKNYSNYFYIHASVILSF